MSEGIAITFLDQTGSKSVKARISPTVQVKKILPNIITKMMLPVTAPDGMPMVYALDHKEGGRRLQETQTLPEAGVKDGEHLIIFPEVVAGVTKRTIECPYCHDKFEENCEYVDIGVGMQQVTGNTCWNCDAHEIGCSWGGSEEERRIGWFWGRMRPG